MIARPKFSQNDWETAERGAFEAGNVALFSRPGVDVLAEVLDALDAAAREEEARGVDDARAADHLHRAVVEEVLPPVVVRRGEVRDERPLAWGRCNVASIWAFRARAFQEQHPRSETVPSDDRSSKNQPKRAENGRERSP